MCRNIKTLHNFAPPATSQEVQAAALQYVRKISGTARPSHVNEQAFNEACETIAVATQQLLDSMVTTAAPRDREVEATKARERSRVRFGQVS